MGSYPESAVPGSHCTFPRHFRHFKTSWQTRPQGPALALATRMWALRSVPTVGAASVLNSCRVFRPRASCVGNSSVPKLRWAGGHLGLLELRCASSKSLHKRCAGLGMQCHAVGCFAVPAQRMLLRAEVMYERKRRAQNVEYFKAGILLCGHAKTSSERCPLCRISKSPTCEPKFRAEAGNDSDPAELSW